jgi:hypothetical protein
MVELPDINSYRKLNFTYLSVDIFTSLDTDKLSSGLDMIGSGSVVDEFLLHCSIILEVWWLLHSSNEGLGTRCVGCFTISLTIYIFRFNSGNITTVAWNLLSWVLILLLV